MFNWSIDWSFITSIFNWVITKIVAFFTGLGYGFVKVIMSILNGLGQVLPDPTPLLNFISNLFSFVSPYIGYIVDMSFISPLVIEYFVGSFIFRILARKYTYVVKLTTGWIERLRG